MANWDHRFRLRACRASVQTVAVWLNQRNPKRENIVGPTGIEGRVLTGYLSLNLSRHRFRYADEYFQSV